MSDDTNDEQSISTMNDWLLSTNGSLDDQALMFLIPPLAPFGCEEALRMAAWLATLADPGNHQFPAVLAAVRNT